MISHEGKSKMSAQPNELALETIGVWPARAVENLRQSWITTADQLIALAATEEGVATIARASGLDPSQVRALLNQTRGLLTPERLGELETPVDTSDYGLGAEAPERPRGKQKDPPDE